ncbi:bifunctional diaminohydroxyphosphoribosylaminopyrimidine deaminase/5-amino-6-(5-phosphoribosylamino)uracil reductase RibD [Oscillibacter valericigenes]|uniref:bifunctional diaminohydroxyphosphoribosylaminopyrimidine deaminase/5-amino-6-(5-phosphoribosylamino)uracil reductase RibD n=1 Tax=Oscillibacter valericigenes TaxID=351091 RepID=UPI001EFF8B30|nr:bifunctional diaminohydroxyphosphoribosylaminopyrimidine deaminase/5-amino-6-(5-phosphoribosylamino)uracil reductase RibD [Oscillibacter valericigenes]MCF2663610.1 bifunctional diaminohydroxyphosphoribosylaminopyrimidine deaminase/5-amino-6-(5-phosphoribosylamino)uracil reductase RibD [Oscillibacter valericigenes]
MNDLDYMRLALELAERGRGWTNPNPMVGAVIVKDGRVIGEGYHHRCGGLHAEREAFAACTESPAGATLYVTLEPCCHHGRQPPCTEAILEAGISRVVVGSWDPNPLVAGKGLSFLRAHGVEVETGVLQEACDALNDVFFHYIRTKRPYVVMKYAMTLDGKIATRTGASQWITGESARERVHQDRHRYAAVMAGVGTVLADDPLLTCRMEGGRNPVRVICDTHLRTPLDSQIVRTAREVPTILACTDGARRAPYEAAGCRVFVLPERDGHVDLSVLMERLGAAEIDSVLLEGGGTLNWAALESGIVQRVQAYIAPKLFGGKDAKSPVAGLGVELPAQAVKLKNTTVTQIGEDFLLEGEVDTDVHGNR